MDQAARRRFVRLALVVLVAAGAGALVAAASESTTGDVIGILLVGASLVAVVAWVFYEIGRSEDVEREKAQREDSGRSG